MKCPKCNASVFDVPFIRMNEKGVDGIFWCEKCAEKHEPELYANEKEDENQVERDLKKWAYPNQ